jgi:hypothetical protein
MVMAKEKCLYLNQVQVPCESSRYFAIVLSGAKKYQTKNAGLELEIYLLKIPPNLHLCYIGSKKCSDQHYALLQILLHHGEILSQHRVFQEKQD